MKIERLPCRNIVWSRFIDSHNAFHCLVNQFSFVHSFSIYRIWVDFWLVLANAIDVSQLVKFNLIEFPWNIPILPQGFMAHSELYTRAIVAIFDFFRKHQMNTLTVNKENVWDDRHCNGSIQISWNFIDPFASYKILSLHSNNTHLLTKLVYTL